jgi:hypothetical protein
MPWVIPYLHDFFVFQVFFEVLHKLTSIVRNPYKLLT